jgi:cell division protein FtsB
VCLCLTTYFGYHAIQGRHGLEARKKLISRSAELDREIKALEAVRARLDHETALLSETAPDPDYIDELARRMLGFARPGDRMLLDLGRPTDRQL